MSVTDRIDGIFARWRDGNPPFPGGQVAVRLRGEMIYDKCFGFADVENGVPVTDDTIFHLASVSKQFTVMAVMLLMQEGRLDIDDDIHEYLPSALGFVEPVTIRQMMTNTSGMRDMWELLDLAGTFNDDTISQNDCLEMVRHQKKLNFEPGRRWMYSNTNFMLLAELVSAASGMSFSEFIRTRITEPLEMNGSFVRESFWQMIPHRAYSYIDNGTSLYRSPLNFGNYGATSMHSCAHDLLRWLDNYVRPSIINREMLDVMVTPGRVREGKTNYAGGIRHDELCGHDYYKHAGEDAGFRTFVMVFPKDELEIVILSNTTNIETDPAGESIARIVLGLGASPREKELDALVAGFSDASDSVVSSRGGSRDLSGTPELSAPDAAGLYFDFSDGGISVVVIEQSGEELFVRDEYDRAPLTRVGKNIYKKGRLDFYLIFGENGVTVRTKETTGRFTKAGAPLRFSEVEELKGRYYSLEIDAIYEIRDNGGEAQLVHRRHGASRLYRVEGGAQEYEYVCEYRRYTAIKTLRDADGAVSGISLSCARSRDIEFKRI